VQYEGGRDTNNQSLVRLDAQYDYNVNNYLKSNQKIFRGGNARDDHDHYENSVYLMEDTTRRI
jgi:hypothetical protein